MIQLPEFDKVTREYAALEMRPMVVRAVLKAGSAVVSYAPHVCLDNLLAYVVALRATRGEGLETRTDGYWIPIPCRMEWASEDGLPLWNCSTFRPGSEVVSDTVYTHKRPPKALFCEAKSIKPGVGRWMERRLPLPVAVSSVWSARCIGNPDAVLDLLGEVAFLGKRRSIGMGEIDEWFVEPGDFETALVDDGRLAHAVPVGCGIECSAAPCLVGWTPPEWKASLYSAGWPVGTAIGIDWFDAAG